MTAATAPASQPKSRGIDYSKFDNIEDSDDEKPQESSSAQGAAKPAVAEKPHCYNCHKDIQKALRCGICKKVEYCSAQCQKEDWQFHKRVCKKPEDPKAKAKAKESVEKKRSTEEREVAREERKKRQEEDKVVDNDENFTWYKHREWKPTAEPKKDFTPTQISAEADVVKTAEPAAGSAWNAAGTWEEKDVTAFALKGLKEKLSGWQSVDAAGGAISAEDVEAVEGEASKPVIRGKMRHMFDLNFKLKFCFKWMDGSGQRQAKGTIEISDFTNDVFSEGSSTPPDVRLSFVDGRLLDAGRKQAVEAGIGASSWPPAAGSLMAQAASRMEAWVQDYQQAS